MKTKGNIYKTQLKISAIQYILFLNITIVNISSYATDNPYEDMSAEKLKTVETAMVEQHILDYENWEKEHQASKCCGLICSAAIPMVFCSYLSSLLTEDGRISIGFFVGSEISCLTVPAFAEWYKPDLEKQQEQIKKLGKIHQALVNKNKEKVD